MWESVPSHGGCGSSSLRECIELLSHPERKSPATCHSGHEREKVPSHKIVVFPRNLCTMHLEMLQITGILCTVHLKML